MSYNHEPILNSGPWSHVTWLATDQSETRQGVTSPRKLDARREDQLVNVANDVASFEQEKNDDSDQIENNLADDDDVSNKVITKLDTG